MADLGVLVRRAGATFPGRVVRKFIEDGGGNQAILIGWNALLAVFPIALAVAAIGGAILSVTGIRADSIYLVVLKVFPQDVGAQQAALQGIEGVRRQTGVFAVVALVGFLWTASGLFGAMEHAFAVVFRTEGRPFLRQKLMSLGMMGLFSVLAMLAVAASALPSLLNQRPGLVRDSIDLTAQVVIGVVSGFVLFFAIYYVVPNRRQALRGVWAGALFSGLAFELLTRLFPVYISLNRGINQYGRSFTFLFVLLAFFYFLGLITMLGAEVDSIRDERPVAAAPPDRRSMRPRT